jgi:hypothetical protein
MGSGPTFVKPVCGVGELALDALRDQLIEGNSWGRCAGGGQGVVVAGGGGRQV